MPMSLPETLAPAAQPLPEPPVTLLLGPPRHGVVRYARELAAAGGLPVGALASRAHVHVTDRALASSPESAAERIAAIAARVPLTVTLHDLPQESDGPRNLRRRGDGYRRICAFARGVAVSSEHEAALAATHLGVRARVIPLGTRACLSPGAAAVRGDVLLAGYLYPGKGHDDAIRAAAEVGRRVGAEIGVQALGAVSAGHAEEADRLHRLAATLGVRFEIAGFLAAEAYDARLRGPGIPVLAHQHVSASRSLLDWLDAGRRPLLPESSYAAETARLRPGTLNRYRSLADALESAWRDPASTVLPRGTRLGPSLTDAAKQYRDWWRDEVDW